MISLLVSALILLLCPWAGLVFRPECALAMPLRVHRWGLAGLTRPGRLWRGWLALGDRWRVSDKLPEYFYCILTKQTETFTAFYQPDEDMSI
jgi:hypothetical protein